MSRRLLIERAEHAERQLAQAEARAAAAEARAALLEDAAGRRTRYELVLAARCEKAEAILAGLGHTVPLCRPLPAEGWLDRNDPTGRPSAHAPLPVVL